MRRPGLKVSEMLHGGSAYWAVMRAPAQRGVAPAVELLAEFESLTGSPRTSRMPLHRRASDFLTVRELAAYLGVSTKTVHREITAGKLPSVRMRNKVTVQGSDALAWLSARKEG